MTKVRLFVAALCLFGFSLEFCFAQELPRCDEPVESGPAIKAVVADLLTDFPGPVLFGLPSGHTDGACMTLPFGVEARVIAGADPAVIIEEAAVA